MSSEQNRRSGIYAAPEQDCQRLLEQLMAALDQHHARDPELHQLYLETNWLLSNQRSGSLILPTGWDLIVFRMIGSSKLRQFPTAYQAAIELVANIRHFGKPVRAS